MRGSCFSGQYSTLDKPTPGSHVTIHGFEAEVRVMDSITSPKVITVIGNDGRGYRYLIKSGEDLRLVSVFEFLSLVVVGPQPDLGYSNQFSLRTLVECNQ
jgi:hypothetical protein